MIPLTPAPRRRRWLRPLLIAVALVAAIVGGAPFIGADRFAAAIHRGLEQKLGRPADLRGEVRFRAFPRPGFTVEDPLGGSALVIHELPANGIEPVAYVSRLEVSVALTSILRGRVELAGIRLVNPSVNLMKLPGGGWNLQPLIRQALGKGSFPSIEVTGGRLNFKNGDLKSVFYMAETDLRVEADLSDSSRFGIRVEGDPARTDQGTRAFGRLSGRGMLTWPDGSPASSAELNMSLSVERTSIAEIASLAAGRPVAVTGFVASRFRLAGPMSDLAIEGAVELDQVERAVLFSRGGSSLELKGRFRLDNEDLVIETAAADAPVTAKVNIASLFGQPHFSVLFSLRDLPASSLRGVLSEIGYPELAQLPVEGTVNGALGWSPPSPPSGQFAITAAKVAQQPPLETDSAEILVAGQGIELQPTVVRMGRQTMTASANWRLDSGDREIRLLTEGMPARDLRRLIEDLLRAPAPPALAWAGNWSGAFTMRLPGDGEASWSGPLRVSGAKAMPFDDGPALDVASAAVSLSDTAWTVRNAEATIDGLPLQFNYSSDGSLALRIGQAAFSQLEQALEVLSRQTAKAPHTRSQGTIHIASLSMGRTRLAGLRARFYWDRTSLALRDVSASIDGAQVSGSINADLANATYRGSAKVRGITWHLGTLNLEGDFETAGSGAALLSALRWHGSFTAWDVEPPAPGRRWDSADGCFQYAGGPGGPKLQLGAVQVRSGSGIFLGRGASAGERLLLDLAPLSGQDAAASSVAARVTPLRVELLAPSEK